jgi:quercetin dioxygenase-like cupin family protein
MRMNETGHPDSHSEPQVPSWVEIISANGHPLTYIIRGGNLPDRTTFLTPPEFKQQVGYVAYPAGGVIARHMHVPIHRHLIGTSEVLVVLRGHAWIDVYGEEHDLVASRELHAGDVMLMVGGGHGFRIIEDTVFLEIKQGPYEGLEEKERF